MQTLVTLLLGSILTSPAPAHAYYFHTLYCQSGASDGRYIRIDIENGTTLGVTYTSRESGACKSVLLNDGEFDQSERGVTYRGQFFACADQPTRPLSCQP